MTLFVDIIKTFPDFKLFAQIEAGSEVVALLGESGCGKSLTLKCIAGIEKPDQGRIEINGETVFDSGRNINLKPQQRKVGYLFQNYALFANMSVRKNIAFGINRPKSEKLAIVNEIIKTFQLESVAELYPTQISGGQQQRVALARILVANPKILMLDEPFSALDSHLKWSMEREIAAVLADFNGSTVFVSHDRDEAYRISDRIAVMSAGKIELIGDKEEIFNSPKTLAAAKITGCKNISPAEKIGMHLVKAVDWGIMLKTAEPVPDGISHACVHADSFELADGAAAENSFSCHVHNILDEPSNKLIEFTFTGGQANGKTILMQIPKSLWKNQIDSSFVVAVPANKVICLE